MSRLISFIVDVGDGTKMTWFDEYTDKLPRILILLSIPLIITVVIGLIWLPMLLVAITIAFIMLGFTIIGGMWILGILFVAAIKGEI